MSRPTPPPPSWASDLRHPLPLAAVAILAINDHLLKGSGLLPAWLTGKLSDFAGLFFFPLLLAALVRGALRLAGRPDVEDRRALAGAAILATGVVFTLIKLHAPFNAWVGSVWGANSMDATDLWALPMLPLSAAFLVRGAAPRADARRAPSHARRLLDLAAVSVAALASIATSAPHPRTPPQQAARAAVAVAPRDTCASLAVTFCERSSSMTYVTVEATDAEAGGCTIDVMQAVERAIVDGVGTVAERLPSNVRVGEGAPSTFSLTFLRPVSPPTEGVLVTLHVRSTSAAGGTRVSQLHLSHACAER
jgi:hypothetical protein